MAVAIFHVAGYPGAVEQYGKKKSVELSAANSILSVAGGETVFEVNATGAGLSFAGATDPGSVGRVIVIRNVGANTFALKHNSGSAGTTQKFQLISAGDVNIAAGSEVVLFFDVDSAPDCWVDSTEVHRAACKLAVAAAGSEILLLLSAGFWSMRNTGLDNAGAASSHDVFYRYGLTKPTGDYAVTTAAKRASIPVPDGQDEVIHVRREDYGIFLVAVGGTVDCVFRRNDHLNSNK